MDNFELKTERKVNWKPLIWNILTLVVLLGVCGLAYYFWNIFNNPYSALNPFPPALLPTSYETATPTSTIIPLESTWTSTPTISPVASRTKAPTWTLLPQMITPTATSTPTLTPTEPTPTIISTPMPASAVITYMASTAYHPDNKCNWSGVVGKVFGTDGKPLLSQQIQLGGTLDGTAISFMTLSGLASAVGPSGFEFQLGDRAIASTQTLWIQLLDNTSKPLTDKIYFDTQSDCAQNLVMVVFTRTR
jgi:hypothetical protein